MFLQKNRVFMFPAKAEKLCKALAEKIRAEGYGNVSQIVSPAVGGIIPGYETARHLGVPAIFTERVNGVFELELRDLAQLTDVLATLKRTPGLSRVHRASVLQASAIAGMEGVFSAEEEKAQ